ncbi:transcriptional regulator, TetR family [Pedobacter westerhofensis]|uniref:Transcriptional regulator, TetR family n=1 Tax=Pedobacter westerhofensis TaxID=425512 RepID=A0A521FMB0_9SPHI|nr:TetR/AcrR family transcriptional regulator [Pedobacter westerhofensis]SMO97279.1 transcriptional regulator, TetR family [Pedobacter westerhofensis]
MDKLTKAERTKQFIIEKAAPIFMTKGVAGTSMSDIMEATQLAKGSLYVHFENKEELSYSVVDYNLNAFVDRTLAAVNTEKNAKLKLFAMLDFLSDPLNPPVAGGCPMMNFGMEADDTSPIIRDKVCKIVVDVQKFIQDTVEEGMEAGLFKKTWNAAAFATKTYAMIEGGILISRVSGNNDKMNILMDMLKAEIEEQSILLL